MKKIKISASFRKSKNLRHGIKRGPGKSRAKLRTLLTMSVYLDNDKKNLDIPIFTP